MATIKYRAHCADFGWQDSVDDGAIAGTVGENRALECYRIEELNIPGLNVHAFAYVQDYGWSAGNVIGEDVGSTGLGKHIEAVKMGLIGEDADKYDIFYRLHVQDRGFMNWSQNGEVNGTIGGNVQAEAIQIYVAKKGTNRHPTVQDINAFEDLTPKAPPTPTVDIRQKVLDTARSHLGYVSGTSNDSAFGRRYAGANAGSWCAYFVRAVMEDAGVTSWIKTGYCPDVVSWAKRNGRWTGNPEPGFAVLYDFNYNGTSDHIGIVEKVYNSGHVVAIEGNTGSPVGVYRKDRSSGILGYVNPY